ncbi:hypothetical protein [Brevundimonas subvibrioides]|uniref:Uncharacterized protein n=1 Tax=Brevundimonas subvibrioides (strain ATCC 15264 / DSM 4735 / LMG 14903 / NBRC 16000 / CB 81) TaxID=633149 RepID=D9QFY9_BRESC|nr:hypothetical protein [Brevundimonas subvibrioides]ADL00703.1 conserved hypothetical protein [Brevundimonas subvibrioides ATCC 15264]
MEVFNPYLFVPTKERWRIAGSTIGGGVPVAGAPGLARTDGGGFWVCEQTEIDLYETEQLKEARRLMAALDGGSRPAIVFAFTGATKPGPGSHSYFTDAPAALRATTLVLKNYGNVTTQNLKGGEDFSMFHPGKGYRLYRVASIVSAVGGVQTVTIRPPLREAVLTNVSAQFDTPACQMRLANPDDFLDAIDGLHTSVANPVWVESFDAA